MKKILIAVLLLPVAGLFAQANKKGYYQITIYNFATVEQERLLDGYLNTAYLPALHKQQLNNIGVFKPLANDTAANKQLYIIIPLQSFEQAATLAGKITADAQYTSSAKAYLEAVYSNPPYKRMENILLEQFPMAPYFTVPKLRSDKNTRVYELRSYESATEKIHQNKVHMFNEGGEIPLFARLNFNATFYAKVIIGSHQPNLMYMTCFENMADRDEHWKQFVASEEWKKLSALPEYQHNISKLESILMKAADYSDY